MSHLKMHSLWACLLAVALVMSAGCDGGAGAPQASTLDTVLAKKELVVGVKPDAAPFSFRVNGAYAGYDVDLAEQIAKRLGVKVRYVPVTSANRIETVNSGAADLIAASMSITREREKQVDFSLSYFATKQAFLVKRESPVTGYLDLAKKKVAALKGSTSAQNLKVVQPDAEAVAFDSEPQAFEALKTGKVDAITSDLVLLMGLPGEAKDDYRVVGAFGYEPYGLALRQNDSKFRDRVNEILQELWDEGKIANMIENWFGERSRYPTQIEFTMETFPVGK